ncbi:MAG: conjugal transfer protein TraG N-terminal domain-containing protein [Candidatus Paracaedibacter sp.]
MDFTVYSYGGAQILWKVFSSLAMLATSTYFYKLSILMIGVALLTVAARAIPVASLPFLFKKWIMPTFFLMAFFWGPKVKVDIVDHVDTNFKASSVANVPFGVAFAASLTTKMSDVLVGVIEKFMTTSDMERYSQVGPMFGARLMYEARTLTIRDPLMRENLKDFTRQCYAWPYVFTNIAPGKKAALESQDMLGFIETNAHKALGMYWRYPDGKTEFMFCSKCAAKVREVIPLEVETGFQSLAKNLFGGTSDGVYETQRLKQYFGDAWSYLAKGSSDAANVIQQELMLNSYRAALQDKREEFGLARNPALSYLNAERGQVQQDESSLVKFALFGTQVPMLHSIFMAIALMFFIIVAPFTFMNGGLHLIQTFAKVMLWLATWAPLSAILNALGHMYLAKANAGQLMGYGEGLNLMTQSGLADSAYHAYAFVMGLQLTVPAVSWALLSGGGGYAMSQLATSLTQGSESFAAKAGAEVVDGNMTFDSQTLHHKSVANTQLAQQQLSPNINSGSRIDDGTMATTYGVTKDGEFDRTGTFQQHLTNMGTNKSANDGVSALWQAQSNRSLSSSIAQSKSAAEQVQLGSNELFSIMKDLSTTEGFTNTFGESGNSNVQKSISETVDQVESFAKSHNLSNEKAMSMLLSGAVEAKANFGTKGGSIAPGGVGAAGLLGNITTGVNASLGGQYRVDSKDSDSLSKSTNIGDSNRFAANLSHAINYLDDKKGSIGDSLKKGKLEQIQHNFSTGQSYGEQAVANRQEAEMYSEGATFQRQQSMTSSSNLNDESLQKFAEKKHGGDIFKAAQQASLYPQTYRQEISSQIDRGQSGMRPTNLKSESSISNHYESAKLTIKNAPSNNSAITLEKEKSGFANEAANLENKVSDKKRQTKFINDLTNSVVESSRTGLENNQEDLQKEYSGEKDSWAITRMAKKLWK